MRIFFLKRCEKGKPAVRRGRKATGLFEREIAELPNKAGGVKKPQRGAAAVHAPERVVQPDRAVVAGATALEPAYRYGCRLRLRESTVSA